MGLVDVTRWYIFQLGAKLFDENAILVLILALLYWIVHTECINPSCPALHLKLGIVYPWLEIQKRPGEVALHDPPVKEKIPGPK